ncbi:MAG: class I SAM-dependent methyltransferase [Polyangiaceae bacterium]|nr:class I SAM-dependent methyltransferase [Polyangiaceae bacterium]
MNPMQDSHTKAEREDKAKAYYDAFSKRYDDGRDVGYHALIDDLEVDIAKPFARRGKILELGCGTGLILSRLAEVAEEAHGIDLSEGMIAKARAQGLNVRVGSVTDLPYEDNMFDFVYSYKVLSHVPDIGRALAEAARVTRPGGHLALEFYNPLSIRYLSKRVAGPRSTGDGQTEADMYTRWDAPWVIPRLLPPKVELVDFRGVRVFTPAAMAFRVPALRAPLVALERAAVASPLRYFGGFLVAILRKRA